MTFDDEDNSRVQTHTEYKTLDPVWQRVRLISGEIFPISLTDCAGVWVACTGRELLSLCQRL